MTYSINTDEVVNEKELTGYRRVALMENGDIILSRLVFKTTMFWAITKSSYHGAHLSSRPIYHAIKNAHTFDYYVKRHAHYIGRDLM